MDTGAQDQQLTLDTDGTSGLAEVLPSAPDPNPAPLPGAPQPLPMRGVPAGSELLPRGTDRTSPVISWALGITLLDPGHGWMHGEELLGQTAAQLFSLARTKSLPGFQWIFFFFGLYFYFYPSALYFFFPDFWGVWEFPEDAGAAVDAVVGTGAFEEQELSCLRRLLLPHLEHPSRFQIGKQEQERGEAKPQQEECHPHTTVTLRDN